MSAGEDLGELLDPRRHPVLSIEQAGLVLGLGRSSAYEAARAGAIPTIRLSQRRVVVPTAALRALLGMPVAEQ